MPHPFFDALVYPWHRAEAIAFHNALYVAIGDPGRITTLYRKCGEGLRPLTPGLAADLAWREVLENLTTAHALQKLCDFVLADHNLGAVYVFVEQVKGARDLLQEPLLEQDLVFVDRKPLRTELQKISSPTSSQGVLLVRGGSGSGKSWTEHLVAELAKGLGARCVYLFEGIVSTVDEVVDQLFTVLNSPGGVPPMLETEDAWFRKVCIKLQELAQKEQIVTWIVADDLGEYPEGPRLDPKIRRFFNQFALTMANPAFARWFRLVLLDYPEGPVPTKWRSFWVEDRPTENDVDEARISEFLLHWAARKQKQLGQEKAVAFAADIVAKVGAPLPPAEPARPRLKRIHDELVRVIDSL